LNRRLDLQVGVSGNGTVSDVALRVDWGAMRPRLTRFGSERLVVDVVGCGVSSGHAVTLRGVERASS
jgi:hypothetical protein